MVSWLVGDAGALNWIITLAVWLGQCIVCCQWTRFDGCGGGGRRRFSQQLVRRSWPGIVCAGSRCKVALNVLPITCVCGWSYLIRAVAYAGRCPKSLCWGHSEAFSESWVAFCASGLETGLQRLSRSGTRLLAGCGFGRNGPQRQVHTIAVT